MASYNGYQVDRNKHKKGTNIFKKTKSVDKTADNMSKNENMRTQIKTWTTFYRLNMHRFVEHYFGIELFLFQKILIFLMNLHTFFMLVAARGLTSDSPI